MEGTFLLIGLAIEDLAQGAKLLERAKESGTGQALPL